jgi:hypothetical protein
MRLRGEYSLLARGLFGLGLALIVVAGLFAGRNGPVRADTSNTFNTTTDVVQSGTMTTAVTTPGVTITSSTPVNHCQLTGIGTATVTRNSEGHQHYADFQRPGADLGDRHVQRQRRRQWPAFSHRPTVANRRACDLQRSCAVWSQLHITLHPHHYRRHLPGWHSHPDSHPGGR